MLFPKQTIMNLLKLTLALFLIVNSHLSLLSKEVDRRLNYYYNEIMNRSGIDDSSKNMLQISQRNWIKFRDSEFQYISSQFKGLYGSMYPKITLIQQVKVVAHRVKELKSYNKLLSTRE